jgi:2-haloacid dehalogenase
VPFSYSDDEFSFRPDQEGDAVAQNSKTARVLVFDVIETMLDLRALYPAFERAFGEARVLDEWFAQMLQTAFGITVAGRYADFGAVARGALRMTAEKRGITMSDEAIGALLQGLRSLPPHPDVEPGLKLLREAGFKLAALTNSARPVLEAQLTASGLLQYFDKLLSVDSVRQFKPAPAVYQHAAKELGVEPRQLRMVAAHGWDVGGALQAGCAAAFVARAGMVLNPLYERPDIVEPDMVAVARRIAEVDSPGM